MKHGNGEVFIENDPIRRALNEDRTIEDVYFRKRGDQWKEEVTPKNKGINFLSLFYDNLNQINTSIQGTLYSLHYYREHGKVICTLVGNPNSF